jgi:hypothetical protein
MMVENTLIDMFVFIISRLDEELSDDDNMNTEVVDNLKKDLDTMLSNFEEHLKRKYPVFVFHLGLIFNKNLFSL